MSRIRLFHTGYLEIRQPDIRHGRKNADFGQGFYLSPSDEFAGRWAKERRGSAIIVNTYELETDGLKIKHLERDAEWFRYIFSNRRATDLYPDYDVIIGPIANDTIYDTLGIFTSGFLSEEQALELLKIGPCYEQIALKTDKAAYNLEWKSSRVMEHGEVENFSSRLQKEEDEYLAAVAEAMASD